jgi:hypothetical protein
MWNRGLFVAIVFLSFGQIAIAQAPRANADVEKRVDSIMSQMTTISSCARSSRSRVREHSLPRERR